MGEGLLFLISILFLAGLVGGSIPRLTLSGPSKAYLASTITFKCQSSEKLPSPSTYEFIKDSSTVVNTNNNTGAGQTVTFHLKVNKGSDGEYFCRVRERESTISSNAVKLEVVIPVGGVHLVSSPEPPIIYEGAGFNLTCHVRKGTQLFYEWYHNQQKVTASLHLVSGNALRVERASEKHAGGYTCLAKNNAENTFRNSGSNEVAVVVKKYLSAPRLSYNLFHNGSDYYANIRCQSARGSPPVRFRMFLNEKEMGVQIVESLAASFVLPVFVGIDMGVMQCRAETETQWLDSDPVDLEVAPVGGTARVLVDYLQRMDSVQVAALLRCVISRGTFPLFSWSFNQTVLPAEGTSHVVTSLGQLVLLDISAENTGYYSCRAKDTFNPNSTWVKSEDVLVKITVYGITPLETIAVAFCCFLLVFVVGGACCLFRNIKHERKRDRSIEQNVECRDQTCTEKADGMPETTCESEVVEMETLILEVNA